MTRAVVATGVLCNLAVRSVITVAIRVAPSPVVRGLPVVSRRIAVMYGWLPVGIVGSVLVVIAALVSHVNLGTSLVEVAAVGIVGVDVESPAPIVPAQWTIEVRQTEILVILIGSQHIHEVSVPAIPPRA